jgi:hypothetical protein
VGSKVVWEKILGCENELVQRMWALGTDFSIYEKPMKTRQRLEGMHLWGVVVGEGGGMGGDCPE